MGRLNGRHSICRPHQPGTLRGELCTKVLRAHYFSTFLHVIGKNRGNDLVQTRASCSIYSYGAMRRSILTVQGVLAASAYADSNIRGVQVNEILLANVPVLYYFCHEPAKNNVEGDLAESMAAISTAN